MKAFVWTAVGLALALCGCVSAPETAGIPAVGSFEAARYMGTWFEVARLPHSFERGTTNSTAVYTLRPDGRVDVVNSGLRDGELRSARAIARFKGAPTTGELRVSFFRPFYADYRIIHLEPDYSASIVTSGTLDYFWILSRTPRLPPGRLEAYLKLAKGWGFDASKFEYPVR